MSDQHIQRYEDLLAKDSKSRAFAPLAEAYRKAGRLAEAVEVAERGLKHNPGYTGGLVVLGRILYEKNELERSLEILQQAVKDAPDNYMAQKFLGRVSLDKGDIPEAVQALDAANMLSPDDQEVAGLLEEARKKATKPTALDFDEPEPVLEEVPEPPPPSPITIDGVELEPLGGESPGIGEGESLPELPEILPVSDLGEVEALQASEETFEHFPPGAAALIAEAEEVQVQLGEAPVPEPEIQPLVAERLQDVPNTPDTPDTPAAPAAEPDTRPLEVRIEPLPAPVQPQAPPPVLPTAEAKTATEPQPGTQPVQAEPVSSLDEAVFEPDMDLVAPLQTAEAPVVPPAAGDVPASGLLTPESPAPPEMEPAAEVPDAPGQGDDISTETLADIYAQQGEVEKAREIYTQLQVQRPHDASLAGKLAGLSTRPEIIETGPEVQPGTDRPNAQTAATLESWLDNIRKIREERG